MTTGVNISQFDTWQPGYANAIVTVYLANTTTPAAIFTDQACTIPADNPQTLLDDGEGNGKFSVPVYCADAYTLDINSTDQTGVEAVPLTTLDGEDASLATVTSEDGSEAHTLGEILARVIYVEDHGAFLPTSNPAASSATNNATLEAAAGVAAANAGGIVICPPGTFDITDLELAAGVVIQGQGRDATTLRSEVGNAVITASGTGAGLRKLTLDGVSKATGGIGFAGIGKDELVLDDVLIKRFETSHHFRGGARLRFQDHYIDDCTNGPKFHGDTNAGSGGGGAAFQDLEWERGRISNVSGNVMDLSYEDAAVFNNRPVQVRFDDNTGKIRVNGVRRTFLEDCGAADNVGTLLQILDDDVATIAAREDNTTVGFFWRGGDIGEGTIDIADTGQDIVFDGVAFTGTTFDLDASLANNILLKNCTEDSDVTATGVGTRLTRWRDINQGQTSGTTTDATATKAWSIAMVPGQMVFACAYVVARQRNAAAVAAYHVEVSAYRPGSTLAYDTQTANFSAGQILTGSTSGATARIQADSDSGATGTLTLVDIVGAFVDNETITDPSGGSALANGVLAAQNVALKGTSDNIRTAYEDDAAWNAAFVANGPELQFNVTGEASKTVDWDVNVSLTSN